MTPYRLTAIGGASAFSKPHSIRSICTELPVSKPVLNECDLTRVRPKRDLASETAFERRIIAATTAVGASGARASATRRCAT